MYRMKPVGSGKRNWLSKHRLECLALLAFISVGCSDKTDNDNTSMDAGQPSCPKLCFFSEASLQDIAAESCMANACEDGFVCQQVSLSDSTSKRCVPNGRAYPTCDSASDCSTGVICHQGLCLSSCALAGSCQSGSSCVSPGAGSCPVSDAPEMMPVADMMPSMPDAGVDMMVPDAMVPQCFSDGAEFTEIFVSDALEGLERVWAGIDTNGDQIGELITWQKSGGDTIITILKGIPPVEVVSFSVAGLDNVAFMPGLWPKADSVYNPISFDAKEAVYVVGDTMGGREIRFHDVRNGEPLMAIPLGEGVKDVTVFSETSAPIVLVNKEGPGCEIIRGTDGIKLPLDEPDGGRCTVKPAWNIDGFGPTDILRFGSTRGIEAISVGDAGGVILSRPNLQPVAVGLGRPTVVDDEVTGPPPMIALTFNDNALAAEQLNPETFETMGGPYRASGTGSVGAYDTASTQFATAENFFRFVIDYVKRDGRHAAHIFNADLRNLGDNDNLRLRGNIEKNQSVQWSLDADADGDGAIDLTIRYGGKTAFIGLRNSQEIYSLSDQPGRSPEPIWGPTTPPRPVDIDGCEGVERLVIQRGAQEANGHRNSSLTIRNANDRQLYSGPVHIGRVYEIIIAELDGNAPPETIEILSEDSSNARLRIYSTHQQ